MNTPTERQIQEAYTEIASAMLLTVQLESNGLPRVPNHWREAATERAAATIPSATREEVGEALHPGLFSLSDYEYARRFDNHGAEARAQHQEAVLADEVDPLLARFTITPKETDR